MKFLKTVLKWLLFSIITIAVIILLTYNLVYYNNLTAFFSILAIIVVVLILYVIQSFLETFGIVKRHKRHYFAKIKKITPSDSFNNMYFNLEQTYAPELEKSRKKTLFSLIIFSVLFAIGFVIFLYLLYIRPHSHKRCFIYGLPLLASFLYYIFYFKKYNKTYVELFKTKIIQNFIESLSPNMKYNPYGGNELLEFYLDAKFNDRSYNSFISDDEIVETQNDGTIIQMANISLENKTKRNNYANTIYEGIFSVSSLYYSIPEKVHIQKNKKIFKANKDLISIDDTMFEEYFDVYSKSDIVSREILTHDIIQELLTFYTSYGISFEIIIKNSHIYIRFDTGAMFEPNVFRKSHNKNTLWVYYTILQFVTSVTYKIHTLLKDLDI